MFLSSSQAYEVLELPIGLDADNDLIKFKYQKLANKWHPDKNNNSKFSKDIFKKLAIAYSTLTDPKFNATKTKKGYEYCLFESVTEKQPNSEDEESDDYEDYSDYDESDDSEYMCDCCHDKMGKYLACRLLESYMSDSHQHNRLKTKLAKGLKHKPLEPIKTNNLPPEQIRKNAQKLILQEEREKKTSLKKREKVNKQKCNGKLQPSSTNHSDLQNTNEKSESEDNDTLGTCQINLSEESEDFDQKAAFFTKCAKKNSIISKQNLVLKSKKDRTKTTNSGSIFFRSRQLATRGNEMAVLSDYQSAVELFTEAINLCPKDYRFFGNRSYCYNRMQQYELALQDADMAIKMAPDWPKGHFRKGKALIGLNRLTEAEQSFIDILTNMEENCEDAIVELIKLRSKKLIDMGFTDIQAEAALSKNNNSFQLALDSLLTNIDKDPSSFTDEVFNSDEENISFLTGVKPSPILSPSNANSGFTTSASANPVSTNSSTLLPTTSMFARSESFSSSSSDKSASLFTNCKVTESTDCKNKNTDSVLKENTTIFNKQEQIKSRSQVKNNVKVPFAPRFAPKSTNSITPTTVQDTKTDPNNPDNLCSLWVGNVSSNLTEKKIRELFQQCGVVTTVRYISDTACAFVNFNNKEAATQAMIKFQGYPYDGLFFKLRFTVNPFDAPTKYECPKHEVTNPEGLCSIWVGNVPMELNETRLTKLFQECGAVTTVRCITDKHCAFINFKTKESASKAIIKFQGYPCGGKFLKVRFPDKPILLNKGLNNGGYPIQKFKHQLKYK